MLKTSKSYYFCRPFAQKYARAMESSWYKRAVDQHSIEPDSFVFSVPFNAGMYIPVLTCIGESLKNLSWTKLVC